MLADSHTHLDQFSDDEIAGMVARARDAGVEMIVAVGTTVASSRRIIDLADRYEPVYADVGIHPMDLKAPFTDDDYATLRDLALSHPKVVCIAETGLDFLDTSPDRVWQDRAFREHIRLARELGKAIDFHAREAHDVILDVLRDEKAAEAGAIWHYFLGDAAKAREAIDLGFYISLAKPLLREPELVVAVKDIPLERIVLETDTYPQPWKKNPERRTEPSHVTQVAEKVAEIWGRSPDEVAQITTANLKRALRLG